MINNDKEMLKMIMISYIWLYVNTVHFSLIFNQNTYTKILSHTHAHSMHR